ncbi:MAG TPA: tRNA uridine-5-carboxymethylaminomethyl(34) synthesis enzyme MnmG [Synergistaceae bacterium]|nr:tRNA uridine-5-carboxymethylaminomethyl(34) synthesis enzyme MnmG [Synergistaceae bacterium]
MSEQYDVIVVGGGHAGCEAALAAARMGCSTLMLNLSLDNAALMACNPSIGGPAKGHLTREIDALVGEQARATDATTLHIRWLNTSKGPAVRCLRAQCDMREYTAYFMALLEREPNLSVFQALVTDLLVEKGAIRGVRTRMGISFFAPRVILTTGTYLGGKVHIGLSHFDSGPLGEMPALGLTASLRREGFEVVRMKTGTPPRIAAHTVDWKALDAQESAEEPLCFSHWNEGKRYSGIACYLTRSTPETHEIIRENLDRSPLYTGVIEGVGPRYCPSIEDRVVRFPEREGHQVFLEPVARDSVEIYMQNFSSSLPFDAQERMVHSLRGCEKAWILRPAYAIEYDMMPPTQLTGWLETKKIRGLFCAGQINGTSGYEEAAAQGLLAGINAVLTLREEEPLLIERSRGYTGVLVDDLVTRGTKEPYRMLTSRCEYRLLLRHDNADMRMAPLGRKLGLLGDEEWKILQNRWKCLEKERERLRKVRISPTPGVNQVLAEEGSAPLEESCTAEELLRRPEVSYAAVARIVPPEEELSEELRRRTEVEIKYEGYVAKQLRQVERMEKMEHFRIPQSFEYSSIKGLLTESRQKLEELRPATLGQARRVSGVTPADIQLLWIALEAHRRGNRG